MLRVMSFADAPKMVDYVNFMKIHRNEIVLVQPNEDGGYTLFWWEEDEH